jgi:hypothetical protein
MSQASERDKLKVFISYSRRDGAIADAIAEKLIARGFEVLIDQRSLPFGEKWQGELADFIRLSDTVIWLVSAASIQSNWVNWELDEVARRNKRLVPVMVDHVERDTLPRQIGEIHILPAEGVLDLSHDFDALVSILESDRAWLKQASRLQDRAFEWLSKDRNSALLLSRGALTDAEFWKDRRPPKAPAPSQEVLELILASKRQLTRRQAWWVVGSLTTAFVSLIFSLVTYAMFQQNQQDERNLRLGDTQTNLSRYREEDETVAQEVMIKQIIKSANGDLGIIAPILVDQSRKLANAGHTTTATALALEVAGTPKIGAHVGGPSGALLQLDRLSRMSIELTRLHHEDAVMAASFSVDGKRLLTASLDKTARIWDLASGHEVSRMHHDRRVDIAIFSRDGSKIATGSGAAVKVWEVATAKELLRLSHDSHVRSIEFSPDGVRLLSASDDGTARVWDVTSGRQITLLRHEAAIASAAFNPNGLTIVTASEDKTARIWETASGVEVARLSHDKSLT